MTKNRALSALLSLALSVLLLAVLVRQLRAGDLPRTLARIFLPALAVYAALTLLSAGLRALRYRWLLRPRRISAPDIVLVTLVRNAFDDLLPARLGSLSYIYMLNKRLGFSFESAAASPDFFRLPAYPPGQISFTLCPSFRPPPQPGAGAE